MLLLPGVTLPNRQTSTTQDAHHPQEMHSSKSESWLMGANPH